MAPWTLDTGLVCVLLCTAMPHVGLGTRLCGLNVVAVVFARAN